MLSNLVELNITVFLAMVAMANLLTQVTQAASTISLDLDKSLLILTPFLTIFGWWIVHVLSLKAQAKEHEKQITYDVYNELVETLDKYTYQVIELGVHLQSIMYLDIYRKLGTVEERYNIWKETASEKSSQLNVSKFSQKWESYEIFLQEYNELRSFLSNRTEEIRKVLMEEVIFSITDIHNEMQFKQYQERMLEISNDLSELTAYVWDAKKELQNGLFSTTYDKRKLKRRVPADSKYKVLTLKGIQ